jgi:hydrogenase maturation protease
MRTAILGVGNLLMKDEGIGVHVARACEQLCLPENVEVIDGGTSIELASLVEGFDRLIVVDAAMAGGRPGQIHRFSLEEIDQGDSPLLSGHEFGIAQALGSSALVGNAPEKIVIVGVEPKEIDWGLELSPELENKIPEIIDNVLSEIEPGGDDARQ